jgi:hypothetical protein
MYYLIGGTVFAPLNKNLWGRQKPQTAVSAPKPYEDQASITLWLAIAFAVFIFDSDSTHGAINSLCNSIASLGGVDDLASFSVYGLILTVNR